jgi:hypothetical protein
MRNALRSLFLPFIVIIIIAIAIIVSRAYGENNALKEEAARILTVELLQMTPIEIYTDDMPKTCAYSEFYYMAVINMDSETFIKTVLVRAPVDYLIREVRINGIEATYTEYPPADVEKYKAYAIPTLKSQAGMDMDVEVSFFSAEKEIKKVILHTKKDHWGFLEQKVAKYLFE